VQIADPMADAENEIPFSILQLHGRAIATSGNYRRGYQIGNQWFSHIIDPRTGNPASQIISATVVATNATDAGALATVFNVLQPEESKALAASISGVEFQIITDDGLEMVSDGWKALEIPGKEKTPLFNPYQGKFTIELELARFEGPYRRPFVAVWIENKKKEPVRTLELWYNKKRWLPDLKRWYSNNQSIMQDSVARASISSATRSAGKYTLVWDGLDATKKPVPGGTYTLYIEAAREHGTYQLIKQEFEWNGKPIHVDLEGGIEITSASLNISK
jgi:FAD:protein FMN transferase